MMICVIGADVFIVCTGQLKQEHVIHVSNTMSDLVNGW